MKKITRIIAVFACVAVICTVFAACGGKETKQYTATTDGKSFTYWCTMDGAARSTLENYNEMLFYQIMEEKTGVHIDFIHPIQGSTGGEAFVTMIASGDLPDMIETNWATYSGGPEAAIDDSILVALDDYIEEYAPNFYNFMEGEEAKKRDYATFLSGTTESGRYYGFNVLNLGDTEGFSGLYCRGDLLEKWGMDIPETIDDWSAYLAKAKEEGFQYPLTGGDSLLSYKDPNSHAFNTAFGVGKAFYLEGDKVVFAVGQKGYKEYIAQMADWFSKGYIDSGIITNDSAKIESNLINGISVASWGYIGSGLGKYGPALKNIDPSYELVACPNPVAKKGDVAEFQQMCSDATTVAIGITTACGNVPAAVKWADWIYSEEGIATQLFGREGDTYTVEEIDGEKHFVYTDKIVNYEENGFSSMNQAMYHYVLPANHPGYNQHSDYLLNYYQEQYQKDAVKTWNLGAKEAEKHALPTLNYTTDEKAAMADIAELCQAPLDVVLYDIIMGRKSMDDYDKEVQKILDLGYSEYANYIQTAYDRYLAKKDVLLNK